MKITEWAEEDRPREKLMMKGVEALSDAELFAILIGSGNTEETAVSLMQRVLRDYDNDLNKLGKLEVRDFTKYNGIGPAKSISIIAALEIGKRRKLQETRKRETVRNAMDVFEMFQPLMCDLAVEHFYVLMLNFNKKVIGSFKSSTGGQSSTIVDVREILRECLLNRCNEVIIIHNHPSGNKRPSDKDVMITRQLQQACLIVGLSLSDHVIVTENEYFSFKEEGLLTK